MNRKVAEIQNTFYGENNVTCEPSKEEIERAVRENDLETRGFQDNEAEIVGECNKSGNFQEYCACIRKYHARRIAFFVVNNWVDPIVLKKDSSIIKDGLHRLKAAIYSNKDTVEIIEIDDL